MMKLALFDLDHTLIPIDSDHAWGEFTTRIGWTDAAEFKRRNDTFYEQYKAGVLDIAEYIRGLPVGEALDENAIRSGYERFKEEKKTRELKQIAARHKLDAAALQAFVDEVLRRRIFDGEALSELMAPLGLGWKARTRAELALVEELTPLLHKLAQGREISGLSAYEQ